MANVDELEPEDGMEAEEGGHSASLRAELDRREALRIAEALVFASAQPVSTAFIEERLPRGIVATEILHQLKEEYAGRGVNLVQVDDHWAFRTAADLSFAIRNDEAEVKKLSRAALEVLAIIAYHQPVTRAEIEDIRGVQTSKGTLDVLMEAEWIAPAGRREVPGRPLIYKTTDAFLQHFGLSSRKDLPGIDDLRAAGLLDPVDLAFDDAMSELDLVKDGEEA